MGTRPQTCTATAIKQHTQALECKDATNGLSVYGVAPQARHSSPQQLEDGLNQHKEPFSVQSHEPFSVRPNEPFSVQSQGPYSVQTLGGRGYMTPGAKLHCVIITLDLHNQRCKL
jgi:hypothetical protein